MKKRFLQHSKADSPLGQAMRDCGLENFTIEVIETCETQEQLNDREKFWIRVLKSKVPVGYNRSDGGKAGGCYRVRNKNNAEDRAAVECPIFLKINHEGKMDLLEMPFVEQVKLLAAYRGYTMKKLMEDFNRRRGTNYTAQSFSRKIKNQTITVDEMKQFGAILGFKIFVETLESE